MKLIKSNRLARLLVLFTLVIMFATCFALVQALANNRDHSSEDITSSTNFAMRTKQLTSTNSALGVKHSRVLKSSVIVSKGDTLWMIAQEYNTNKANVRTYVDKLMKLNGLRNPIVQEGQQLLLP